MRARGLALNPISPRVAGLMYSFPVTCAGGKWTIVRDLAIDAFSREKMDATQAELLEEKALTTEILGK